MKLQMVADLDLEKTVTIVMQSETIQQQQGFIIGEEGVKFLMHKPLLQRHHKKHVQGKESLLLTLEKILCKR